MRMDASVAPRSTASCWRSPSSWSTRSRSFTPRWSNATATLIQLRYLAMGDVQLWRELGQQFRVDSVRCAAAAKSGHPTSGMSGADLMAVLLARHLHYDFDAPDTATND